MLKNFRQFLFFAFFCSTTVFGQNKFEGYNIIINAPDTQTSATCAIRYTPATTDITITDLDRSTPMRVSACGGSTLTKSGSSAATMRGNPSDFKWCFQGEDKKYRISFNGDRYSGKITYDWIATPDARNLGFYNIRDFGAVGDGKTDDTIAIKSALAFITTRGGGILNFPEGDYSVGNAPDYGKAITLPSGITLQGVSGLQSNNFSNNVVQKNPSRISLNGTNRAIFRIGECTEKIVLKDIELYARSNENTFGVEAVGAFMSSQDFYFERVVFNNLFRGIYVYALPPSQGFVWQIDYFKVNHCRFIYNRDAGIYTNTKNTNWKVEGSLFINPKKQAGQNADSMRFERAAAVLVQDTYGGGFTNALGGNFLEILDSGNITVLSSQTEAMTNSLVYNAAENPLAGDYSYTITFLNSVFANPIIFKARRTFVSVGSFYGADTFKADERVRVYSTGDRFCYDGYILGCRGATKNNFDKATVVFMTGQPSEGQVQGHPTFFGTDVQFGAPVQMPSFQQNALPTGKSNGSLVYCSNCKRSTTPCQADGGGAPAMVVAGQWSCL